MKKKIFAFMWTLALILSMVVGAAGLTAQAANPKAVKSVSVRIGKKMLRRKHIS